MTGYESLFGLATQLGKNLDSLYRGSRNERLDILEFMDANDWFGAEYVAKGFDTFIAGQDIPKIRERLELWLTAYRKPGREKIKIMLNRFDAAYPQTCRLYRRFVTNRQLSDNPSAWKLLDFLLSEAEADITDYNERAMEHLVIRIESQGTRTVARLFADFLSTVKLDGKPLSQWEYSFNPRENTELINEAYPMSDFAVMAYCVFSEEMWARLGLIEKAVNNRVYADMWLFVALHFVCALRSGDMERIPAPRLPYDGAVILDKIENGGFAKKEASALVDELRIRLKLKPMAPSKTAAYENVPDIKLFVPESLQAPLGVIMAIALAHHPEIRAGDGFVKPSDSLSNIRDFFGDCFVNAIGNRRFSSRRCNKSYLQGIELAGDDGPGNPKGYMLAALARSHKSGLGRLSDITAAYLKDARFSGYSPEFIMRQMFERGVFSFIPAILLEIYAGPEYVKLPVSIQTRLIGELGLTAFQIEGLAETTERMLIKGRKAVSGIIKNPAVIKETVGAALQNIASGAAPGRQDGFMCLMTAAGLPCPFAGRGVCIGCGYEIYTKTAMYALMREYARLTGTIKNAGATDAGRYRKILEQAVMPAITEMLASAKLLYPDADVSGLLDIMEAEFYGVDRGPGRDGRRLQQVHADS